MNLAKTGSVLSKRQKEEPVRFVLKVEEDNRVTFQLPEWDFDQNISTRKEIKETAKILRSEMFERNSYEDSKWCAELDAWDYVEKTLKRFTSNNL